MLAAPALAIAKPEVLIGSGIKEPFGMDFLPDGRLVFVEFGGHRVVRVEADGKITILAGDGSKGFADGPGDRAKFDSPHNLSVAADGSIYVADTFNHRVRKIDAKTNAVTTVAGTGKKGFAGDGGPAAEAAFDQTYHVEVAKDGKSLLVCDLGNRRIRSVDLKSGKVATLVGSGKKGVPADGTAAADAPLVDPRAVASGHDGAIYVLERAGHALRVVRNGKIETVAGTGKPGYSGDGEEALKAAFNGPKFLWVERSGDVLVADTENHAIRRLVDKCKTIRPLAGVGTKGKELGDEWAEVGLSRPHAVAVGKDGSVYVADSDNDRVLVERPAK